MDLGKLKPVIKDGNTSDKTSFVSKPAVVVSAKIYPSTTFNSDTSNPLPRAKPIAAFVALPSAS